MQQNRWFHAAAFAVLVLCLPSQGADCTRTTVGLIPLTDLGPGLYLSQFQGGLYPGGLNTPPIPHANIGKFRARNIRPLNTVGTPDPAGRYVMLSIGMSNTTQEFCCHSGTFMGRAAVSSQVNHTRLVIANGAAGGQTAGTWDSPADANYNRVRDNVLTPQGVTEAQVVSAWVKVANAQPTSALPNANADANALVAQMGNIVRAMKVRYPNLAIVFLSSRIYAGYASSTLNPEPYAYESAFAVKWLIEAQIQQKSPNGQIDPIAGDLDFNGVAPWLAWGPYLWADGLMPRGDGVTWACNELQADGTHPSQAGQTKVGGMLLDFMLQSRFAAPWFRADGGRCPRDFDGDGDVGTDRDIEAFFACLGGDCCASCGPADFNGDGDIGADDDIESFFRVLGGGAC